MVNQSVKEYEGNLPSSRERQRIVNESGRDAVMFDVTSDSNKIQLWDVIDNTWTAPLERDTAMNHYLRKLVYTCSVCTETSLFEDDIKRHIAQVKTAYEMCADAELVRGIGEHGQPSFTCSGCGAPMSMRKNQGQRHIDGIKNRYDAHMEAGDVEILLTHRYTTSPSVSMPQQSVATIHFGGEKTVVQQKSRNAIEVIRKPRKRRRRRR